MDRQQKLDSLFSLLSSRTAIMGILNATPDSFSDGGSFSSVDETVMFALKMVDDGADIVDIGGESTRPGAEAVSVDEEIGRVCPIIERLASRSNVVISVDTMKAEVAREALAAGADIVNDVSGLQNDPEIADIAAGSKAGLVIMHMKGTPKTMQIDPHYEDLIGEVSEFLRVQTDLAIHRGVLRERIIIDPGFGFAKKPEHNLTLLKHLSDFKKLGYPILIGTSRKSTLGKIVGEDDGPLSRMEATAATVAIAIQNSAKIVRVHDVKAMKKVARMTDAIIRA